MGVLFHNIVDFILYITTEKNATNIFYSLYGQLLDLDAGGHEKLKLPF